MKTEQVENPRDNRAFILTYLSVWAFLFYEAGAVSVHLFNFLLAVTFVFLIQIPFRNAAVKIIFIFLWLASIFHFMCIATGLNVF